MSILGFDFLTVVFFTEAHKRTNIKMSLKEDKPFPRIYQHKENMDYYTFDHHTLNEKVCGLL